MAHPVAWGCHSLRWQILSHSGHHSLRWHILSYGGSFHLCGRSYHMGFFTCVADLVTWGVVHVCGRSCYIGGVIHLLFSCVCSRTVIIISFGVLEPHSSSSCCCHTVTYYFSSAGKICWHISVVIVLSCGMTCGEKNKATAPLILQHTPTDHTATKKHLVQYLPMSNMLKAISKTSAGRRQRKIKREMGEGKERPRQRWVKTKRDQDRARRRQIKTS